MNALYFSVRPLTRIKNLTMQQANTEARPWTFAYHQFATRYSMQRKNCSKWHIMKSEGPDGLTVQRINNDSSLKHLNQDKASTKAQKIASSSTERRPQKLGHCNQRICLLDLIRTQRAGEKSKANFPYPWTLWQLQPPILSRCRDPLLKRLY